MKPSDIQRIERKLKITLPQDYIQFLERYPALLETWEGAELDRPGADYLHDAGEIIRENLDYRRDPDRLIDSSHLDLQLGAARYLLMGWGVKRTIAGTCREGPLFIDLKRKRMTFHPVAANRKPYNSESPLNKGLEGIRANYAALNWGRPRKQPWKEPIRLSVDELFREIQPLVRPCLLLRPAGKEYVAYWNNEALRPPADGEFEHLVSVDVRVFPDRPARWTGGCVHLFRRPYKDVGKAVFDPKATLPATGTGKLYAHQAESLPPQPAIFRFGPPRIQEWLDSNGWEPNYVYSKRFPDSAPVEEYLKRWRKQHPFHQKNSDVAAIIGGWPRVWDIDFEARAAQNLLLWTLRDAEPYWEVYLAKSKLVVVDRIT